MKTTRTCRHLECTESTTDGYCAFHHLAIVTGPDTFSGLLDGVGGLDGNALLEVILDLIDESIPEPSCRHDARLGGCYLTETAEFPGFSRNPWELRAATYSQGIPLN